MRHLTVTGADGGQVVGMITRRDLMGFNLEEKLDKAPQGVGKFATVARTLAAFRPSPVATPASVSAPNHADASQSHAVAAHGGATSQPIILEDTEPFPSRSPTLRHQSPVIQVIAPTTSSMEPSLCNYSAGDNTAAADDTTAGGNTTDNDNDVPLLELRPQPITTHSTSALDGGPPP